MKKLNCILLIDDNQDDNFFHKIIINDAKVTEQIKVVTDGAQGIEYLLNTEKPGMEKDFPKPDVIFLDINMPKMNGFEFLEKYKTIEKDMKSKILIIMLTTSLNPEDQKRALSNKDVTEFQNKPLTVDILNITVKKYFNGEKP